MHKLTALFFVLLYTVAMLRPIQPYVEYLLNQDYIAEFLCINKDKPELQCHGKCYLVKEIEKQQENDSNSLRVSLENYPIGFVEILQIKTFQTFKLASKKTRFPYQKLYYFDYNYSAFQPPDLI
ncbi:hypothetical protein [Flavivirga jejuensis]|uniref:Uncharacterized protein n=1 Tax=Flavivirga jejuensis TaxID=870487 RepID=A0ABT8WIG2_9FLAO|nr:hypothetical protein [Flavivirga jejuensis]MDO5972949.1 hypothetical protein [Flavivirga jejuensis]